MNEKVTIQVSPELKDQIIKFYRTIQKENNGEYILFFGQQDSFSITVYSSKKEDNFKVFFSGDNALKEAKRWDENAEVMQLDQMK